MSLIQENNNLSIFEIMKKAIFILAMCLSLLSCNSDSSENIVNEGANTVTLFLEDVNSLLTDSSKNPIVAFSELAENMAGEVIALDKNNVANALEKAKNFSKAVVVVENHTIVKVTSFEDCQQSGSWGGCMPKGEGFIKKGGLNYQNDYINNIIGVPSAKQVTLYLFKEATLVIHIECIKDDKQC